ncbi:S-layer homology domain-containing protein [bacterium]|nr:S-layer homology domain-containing protein [bacterium]
MRQTDTISAFRNLGLCFFMGFFFYFPFICSGAEAINSNSAFQDLPKDHWAFKDVDFLVKQGYMEGYPDGTFKGRKITTRYDLSLILARILKRMEEKRQGIMDATETERAALSRLTKEFRDELGLLGVRVDTLERRMTDSETKVKSIEDALPKVRVSGFYRGRGQFIIDPYTVQRNEVGDKTTFVDPGLVTFYQQIYLRFTGKPLGEKVETFYELLGYVKGKTWNKLIYNDVGKNNGANPFDKIDDYVTKIQNDRYAQTNKLHFVSNAKSMKVRVFAGEAITGINDPINALTEDTNVVDPYQGMEFSGTDRGLTYQASMLKGDMKIGTTDPNVRAVDLNYTTERIGKTQATAEFLTSTDYHKDTRDGKDRNLGDEATKFDVSYQHGGFTGTAKHYDFGKEFRAHMAPIWAYDVGDEDGDSDYPYDPMFHDNYKHDGFWGEKLTRFSLNYDFGNKLLAIAKNLSMETTWLSKTWEVDPFAPQPTDGYSGRKYTFQLLSDFTDSTTLKYDFEQKLDALATETGTIKNTFELNLKLNNSVSGKGKIFVMTDHDKLDVLNGVTYKYNERDGYFEVNSNLNPRVFAKGSVEHQVRWVRAPKENTRIDYIGEATYNLTPTTTLTGGIQHVDFEDFGDLTKSSIANAILSEFKKNFTDKFRGRLFYARAIIEYKDNGTDDLDRENIYGELIYDISKDASMKFKFGYDYPDDGRWDISSVDNGRDRKDIHTQKMLIFEAKTNF